MKYKKTREKSEYVTVPKQYKTNEFPIKLLVTINTEVINSSTFGCQ